MKIIDIHTHIFPADMAKNWTRYAQRDSYFKLLTDPSKTTIQKFANAEETLQLMDEAGIEKIVIQGWYWNDHELCKYHNDFMHETLQKYPGRFGAFMAINPSFDELALQEIERNIQRGFDGIGELGPGANGLDPLDRTFLQVLECAQHHRLPVNIHCSDPVGREFLGKDATPIQKFYEIARRFPDLTIILAHLGGGLPFYELKPEIKEAFKNVYYDLAANPLVYDIQSVKTVVDLVGPQKLLFGSDFPLLLYPKKSQEKSFQPFISDIVQNSGLDQKTLEDIFYNNSKRILDKAGAGSF